MVNTTCPLCGNEYSNLGKHWSMNESCEYPTVTDKQLDVIRGLIMGDASINHQSDDWNDRLDLSVVSKDFAYEAANELKWLTNRISIREKDGWSKNDQYRLLTYSHPIFNEIYDRWYPNGNKKVPEDFQLNHTILRFWYLGDGSLGFTNAGTPYIRIRANNMSDRGDYIAELFDDLGYKATFSSKSLRISTRDTKELLSKIEAVDDLSYKWETNKSKYDHMDRPYYKGISGK